MRTRILGKTGEDLTTIGLGTWAIGGANWQFGWGPQDDQESIRAIRRALELGINWIDTAAVYGLGHAEEIVGRAVADVRTDVFIATKCGRRWTDEGKVFGRLDAESIRQECEASLRRLNVDFIDLYQIHWPHPDEDIEEAWTEMARMVEKGMIRYAGVSNFSVQQMERVSAIHPITSLQPPYNMLERDVEQNHFRYCLNNGIGIVAYSPMMSGLLTGKFTAERLEQLPTNDWRLRERHFQQPEFAVNLDLVNRLRTIADRNGLTLPQLSIAWVLRRPTVTSAIVGARRPDQIEETAPAGDVELPESEITEIENLLEWREEAIAAAA